MTPQVDKSCPICGAVVARIARYCPECYFDYDRPSAQTLMIDQGTEAKAPANRPVNARPWQIVTLVIAAVLGLLFFWTDHPPRIGR